MCGPAARVYPERGPAARCGGAASRARTGRSADGWDDHVEMIDPTNRWAIRGDPARLTEAAEALRGAHAEEIFGTRFPGEYVMSGIARLLDSLAREMREDNTLSHEVVSAASEMSEHVLAYLSRTSEKG